MLVDRRRDVEGLTDRFPAAERVVELFGEGACRPVAQARARPHADDVRDAHPRESFSRSLGITGREEDDFRAVAARRD